MRKSKKRNKPKSKRLITYNTSLGGKYPYPLTLSGVKTQALLVFANEAFKSAINIEQKELSPDDSNLTISKEEEKLRDAFLHTLHHNLIALVDSYHELQSLLQLSTKNQSMFIAAKQHSPLSYYFNVIASKYDSLISKGDTWIPEVLGLALIYQWINEKEKNLLNSYSFINDLEIEKVMDIYRRSYLAQKNKQITNTTSTISKMLDIADKLVEELDNSKFPIKISFTILLKRYLNHSF